MSIAKRNKLSIHANVTGPEDVSKSKLILEERSLRSILDSDGNHCMHFVFCSFRTKLSVVVKWELKDVQNSKTIICVLIPARIE